MLVPEKNGPYSGVVFQERGLCRGGPLYYIPTTLYKHLSYDNVSGISANQERSNLYLKLFKMVFGSVSLLAAENEQMLKVSASMLHRVLGG